MTKKRVLVAMSGGVDSSVAAALLLEQGYEVEGATMQIWPDLKNDTEKITKGCCSLSAVDDARAVANRLGIRYHVLNFKDCIKNNVISPFITEYLKGRTPNPCIMCNRVVKFEEFLRRAQVLGFDYIATGHYGIVENTGERYLLRKGVSDSKDQTYALYNLTQPQLKHLLLPIGTMDKPAVREYAKNMGIPVFDKPDSQEICFVDDNDYAGFITREGYTCPKGDFVDTKGNVIGQHRGIIHYTVGQRKHLGMTFGKPMFVCGIDAQRNQVILGDNADTFKNELFASDMNWIAFDDLDENGIDCMVKIRYNGPAQLGHIEKADGGVKVTFKEPARAVTPGQAVVFYDGDVVLGGGTIDR